MENSKWSLMKIWWNKIYEEQSQRQMNVLNSKWRKSKENNFLLLLLNCWSNDFSYMWNSLEKKKKKVAKQFGTMLLYKIYVLDMSNHQMAKWLKAKRPEHNIKVYTQICCYITCGLHITKRNILTLPNCRKKKMIIISRNVWNSYKQNVEKRRTQIRSSNKMSEYCYS